MLSLLAVTAIEPEEDCLDLLIGESDDEVSWRGACAFRSNSTEK
jgi:hypothetical protein